MRSTRLSLVVSLALLIPAAAFAQERRHIGVDDLFSIQRVGSPQVSPDGEWIAYTVSTTSLEDEKSYTRIWMVPSAGGDPIPLTAEGKSAGSPDWSPDGRYLWYAFQCGGGFLFVSEPDAGVTRGLGRAGVDRKSVV